MSNQALNNPNYFKQLTLLAALVYGISIFFNSSYIYLAFMLFVIPLSKMRNGNNIKNSIIILLAIYSLIYFLLPNRGLAIWFTQPLTVIELIVFPILKLAIVYLLFRFLYVQHVGQSKRIDQQKNYVFICMFLSFGLQSFIMNVNEQIAVILGIIVTLFQISALILLVKLWIDLSFSNVVKDEIT